MPGERMSKSEAEEFYNDLSLEDYLREHAGRPFNRGDWVVAVQGDHAFETLQVIATNPDGSLKLRGEDQFNFFVKNKDEVFHMRDFEEAKKQFPNTGPN